MFDGFFGYLIGGAVIGVLARILKPGPENIGLIMTILIGAVGAAIGGRVVGEGWLAWVVAIASAIVLLVVWQRLFHSRRGKPGAPRR